VLRDRHDDDHGPSEQSVKPVASLEDVAGDVWPESESDEEVVTTIRKWRRQGG
jgi:hypothetical protein